MQSRDNVTNITHRVSPFPQESTLYFPVAQKPLYYTALHGRVTTLPTHKLLVRKDDNKVQPLAVVGTDYNTLLNGILYPYVEEKMIERLGPERVRDVQTKELTAYGGRDCYREYTFPSVTCDVPGGGGVAFRLYVGNSYGKKAVLLISGAIVFRCDNGCILGVHESIARKHTKGLTLTGLDKWLDDSVIYFTKHGELMAEWARTPLPLAKEESLFKALVKKSLVSERGASKLNEGMHYERTQRNDATRDNPTLWHLYNALTAWASHGDVRDTGHDHVANTRIDRGKHVNRVMQVASDYLRKAA